MANNRAMKETSGPWGRLKSLQQDPLESMGLPSKGDMRLLDFKVQEAFYTKIVDRYMAICSDAGQGVELLRRFSSLRILDSLNVQSCSGASGAVSDCTGAISGKFTEGTARSKNLPNILTALRKLREGVVAAKRMDVFAAQVYLFSIRTSILARDPESYHPAILHLLRVIQPRASLTPSEVDEVAGYLVLDAACRRRQLAEAVSLRHQYGLRDNYVKEALHAVIHDNYAAFRRIQRRIDGYKARLMEWADKDMRLHSLKCLGRTYHSVDLKFLETITESSWNDLRAKDGVGWELMEGKVIIRKVKNR